jgi:hypothetical protein
MGPFLIKTLAFQTLPTYFVVPISLTPKEVAAVKGLSLHDCTIVGSFELPFRLV